MISCTYDLACTAGVPKDAPEVPHTNWNASSEQYSFLYQSDTSADLQLLLKALPLGDALLVTLASSHESASPQTLELPISHYTTSETSTIPKSYQNLEELCDKVNAAVAAMEPQKKPKTTASAAAAAAAGPRETEGIAAPSGQRREAEPQRRDPDYDPLRIGPPRRPMPLRAGEQGLGFPGKEHVPRRMCLQ